MKKLLVGALILLFGSSSFAQGVELTPVFGYSFAGRVNNYGRYFDVRDNAIYGGILSVEVDHLSYVELSYQRSDTEGYTRYDNIDMAVEHYQVGALREFQEGMIVPFAKVSLGTSRYVQKSQGDERVWFFSGGIGIGAKVFLNDRIGLRFFSNLMMPLEFNGAGFWCGIGGGGGCSGGVDFNVPLVHWDSGVGLIIDIGK
ncbi:hypothetical protein OU798_16385 [Prolixibacteraceae bacterium Z1-6]|uniref:Outer membrane protein beta-barrel domain-containing protein n=1 Tax=Draconibacterium aestuarii TaxID=2998507 RepID=A0A9X3J6Z0_9BACT|nr:hypothetical protein [Prolixibacteraceae bacterium Z1-6]